MARIKTDKKKLSVYTFVCQYLKVENVCSEQNGICKKGKQ